jgi:hypothetical protein
LLLGYVVFSDVPDAVMVLDAAIIVLSGLYAFYRERVRRHEVASASGLLLDWLTSARPKKSQNNAGAYGRTAPQCPRAVHGLIESRGIPFSGGL